MEIAPVQNSNIVYIEALTNQLSHTFEAGAGLIFTQTLDNEIVLGAV